MQTEDNKELKLLRSKITYLVDRIEVMTKSLSRVNNILGRFQMTENNDTEEKKWIKDKLRIESLWSK
jgi:hypothetical protein